jgi:hypothetical protein
VKVRLLKAIELSGHSKNGNRRPVVSIDGCNLVGSASVVMVG